MKGIILAGGIGTRLYPLTKICNKCLLPVYNKPMIYWSTKFLINNGIKEIIIVCGGGSEEKIMPAMASMEDIWEKATICFAYQPEPKGIADAIQKAESWCNNEHIAVILSDNILLDDLKTVIDNFDKNPQGAVVFAKEVENPHHYGIAYINEKNEVYKIEEKPKNPNSNLAVVGFYLYDSQIWNIIKNLKPSHRGELEITDVNNYYLKQGKLILKKLNNQWIDCGENFDSLLEASTIIKQQTIQTKG